VRRLRTTEQCQGALEANGTEDRNADHLELVRRLAVSFGACAEGLLEYHDVGFPKDLIRRHIANVEAGIREMREANALGRAADALPPDAKGAWNRWKNLRYAAGALMITERFRGELGPDARIHALVTKIFYESLLDTLDDIIDSGSYGFADALDLIRHCLAPVTERSFDAAGFRAELEGRLAREHRGLADFLTALVETSRRNLRSAPHASAFAREFERMHERWAFGQALTMFQKDPTLDVDAFIRGAARLPGPDADLSPIERLSGAISHTAALTLIDACFLERPMPPEAMDEHLAAWFYFDAVLTLISNVMDLGKDLDAGILNIFLISRRGETLSRRRQVRGYRPDLTMDDYEAFLARASELTERGLRHARQSGSDPGRFYPFVTLMFPVVAFTDETGSREDLIHAYLRVLAPILRGRATPNRPTEVTIPRGIRSGRTRSARTTSS